MPKLQNKKTGKVIELKRKATQLKKKSPQKPKTRGSKYV